MQTKELTEEELERKKKLSKFDNFFFDALYNVVTFIPAAIISWFISTLE
jgi:hypothetical protein